MGWTDTARRQQGFVTKAQLRGAAVAEATIGNWLRGGRLERTSTQGVYRVAGAPETELSAAWFAALASRSVVSYVSAALWWGMPVADDGLVHVTRLDRRRLDWPPGVRVHRVGLLREDCVRERGLWVTTRPETVLDCMGWQSPGRALVLADRAVQQGWLRPADIDRRLEQSPGRWGNKQLRRLAAHLSVGADAESERRLIALLRRHKITGWVAQLPFRCPAGRFVLDLAFPEQRLAIEVDGYTYHSGDARFQRDRTRQNALIAAGWRVLRFTWVDIIDRPDYVLAQIRTLLAADNGM